MYSYATLGATDMVAAQTFFDACLNPLGICRFYQSAEGLGYRADGAASGGSDLWVVQPFNGGAPSAGNGAMLAFAAPSAEAVQAFHAAALAGGGTDEGAPGYRAQYSPGFYAAYVRDPHGNKLCAVWRDPARTAA